MLRVWLAGNIHCHLLPALIILGALLSGAMEPWPHAKLAWAENVLPIFVCLCGSVTYHTFMANHQHYRRWILVDVSPHTSKCSTSFAVPIHAAQTSVTRREDAAMVLLQTLLPLLQVCGVFVLLLAGVHTLMWWGLYCYPYVRNSFIAGGRLPLISHALTCISPKLCN